MVDQKFCRRLGALAAMVAISAAMAGVLSGCAEDSASSPPEAPTRPLIDVNKIPRLSQTPIFDVPRIDPTVPRLNPTVPDNEVPRNRAPNSDWDVTPDAPEVRDADQDGREDWQEPSGCMFDSDCNDDGIGDANDP